MSQDVMHGFWTKVVATLWARPEPVAQAPVSLYPNRPKRVVTDVECWLQVGEKSVECQIADVSDQGLRLRTGQFLGSNKRATVRLFAAAGVLRLNVEMVWNRRRGLGGEFGARILGVSDERRFDAFVTSMQLRALGRHAHGGYIAS